MFIYSWSKFSEGASELAQELGAKKIKHENSKFKGNGSKVVINWGSSNLPKEVLKCKVLNRPENVALCSDKLKFFEHVDAEICPEWVTSMDVALSWVAEGHVVCARTVLNGHSAEGLVLMDRDHPNDFVRAPLYTKYIPKKDEFRVHVIKGEIVDVQRKVLKKEKLESGDDINWKIRNLDNGFIYQREGIDVPDRVKEVSIQAVKQVGLDFGAVDVVVDVKTQAPKVLEVNTAPGITGTTAKNYAETLRGL